MITFIYLFTSSEHDPVNDCVCQWLSCVQLYDPMDCSPPGSSVQGILQARVLEWVAISFSRGYSWHRDRTPISCIAGGFFTVWATREVLSVFRHKNSIVVGEETEAHWPPTPDFYLPVQGLGYTLLHSTPSRISCRLLPGGRVSGAHLMACVGRGWPGSRAVDGGAGGEVWLEEQMLCARGGWSALNRGPQLGFHNDINGGQAEPSVVQMGKLRWRLLQSLRGEGPAISPSISSFIFPRKAPQPRNCNALSAVTQWDTRRNRSWATWPHRHPPLLPRWGAPSPTSAAGRRNKWLEFSILTTSISHQSFMSN